ncbi:putative RNA methyltransferase [Tupanvirus soda lake]|uniref:RNA methyltransferase n=2 Tax=Tupanvirus TaxID=2094720 RepID=A0AC62ABY5_9VIRU|nr:putative RNA methyltransferase [Tupanvirus soda lake]QKU35261.1 putative RNA methyltransferase [Tupanvirus soda lake]
MTQISDNCLALANMPYSQQLEHKLDNMKKIFPMFSNPVIPSPITDFYRNKLRFDVGPNSNGKISVGYALSKKQSIDKFVYSAVNMRHLNTKMIQIITILEDYLNNYCFDYCLACPRKWFSVIHNKSIFHTIIIRSSFRTNDSMIIMKFNSYFDDEIAGYFNNLKINLMPHPSIIIECFDGLRILKGNNYITERLDEYIFRISSDSFFQVNTFATEILYAKVKELSLKHFDTSNKNSNILFDLCCGTGTIGIYLTDIFTEVIGIEINKSAVIDANINKEINNTQNIRFVCSPIENSLQSEIHLGYEKYSSPKFFAIVDPPRTGMHGNVHETINQCRDLNYLIYVSCNAITLKRDLLNLEKDFGIVEMHYIDLFPHTPHCEVICVLKRKIQKIDDLTDSIINIKIR